MFLISWVMDWLNRPLDLDAELKKYRDKRDQD
jgi:hypothetical protein